MIPTVKITQDITVLMYLKAVFIDVSFSQAGRDTWRIWTSWEELEKDEYGTDSDETLRWQPTGVANPKHQTTSSMVNIQDMERTLEPSLGPNLEPFGECTDLTPENILEPALTFEPISQTSVGLE